MKNLFLFCLAIISSVEVMGSDHLLMTNPDKHIISAMRPYTTIEDYGDFNYLQPALLEIIEKCITPILNESKKFEDISCLSITNKSFFNAMASMPLSFKYDHQLKFLQKIIYFFPNVVFLDYSNHNLSDISPIISLTQLKELNLSGVDIDDENLACLSVLTKLTYLNLKYNGAITNNGLV